MTAALCITYVLNVAKEIENADRMEEVGLHYKVCSSTFAPIAPLHLSCSRRLLQKPRVEVKTEL